MISQASELLALFIKAEKEKLQGEYMPHMPTLGSAYEEITKQGIDQEFVIPKFLDLRVVSGFIEVATVMLPEQVDCMLVVGDGRRFGITEQYIYDIEQVLCIFEVKKTLRKADFVDAFDHLGRIRKKFSEYFEEKLRRGGFAPDVSRARRIFSQITGRMAPEKYLDIHELSKPDGILFYALVQEHHAPVTIIHGYEGYKTEHGLRGTFIDIIEEKQKVSQVGLGVPSLPTLVTSNNFCLVKSNGHPYIAIREDGSWAVICSARHNPARIILELIWSKISSYWNVRMPWEDGLETENVAPLLLAKPVELGKQVGWAYESIEYKEKRLGREERVDWKPVKVGAAGVAAINIMVMRGGYLPLDAGMSDYVQAEYRCALDDVVDELVRSRFFAKEGDFLCPITSMTHVLTNDDGSGYVAVERDRFDLWCQQYKRAPTYLNIYFLDDR